MSAIDFFWYKHWLREWTAAFSADGSQMSSGSQAFTATYDQVGTVSLNLTACDAESCLQASHTIEVLEAKENSAEQTPTQ